jgi:signal peptidase I
LSLDDHNAELEPSKLRATVPGSRDGGAAQVIAERVEPEASVRPPRRRKSLVREYAEAIAIAILLALVIRTFVVQAFTFPSGSMMDTLLVGDYILVNKFLYGPELPLTDWQLPGLRQPERGDIIVFKYPQDEKRDFIKRVIGTPGEVVQVRGHQVIVNGRVLDEPYTRYANSPLPPGSQASFCGYAFGCEPTTVPSDSYFVMGDNRDNSQDSRYWGFVKRDKIKGKAFLIYWSWDSDRHWLRWWRLGKYVP